MSKFVGRRSFFKASTLSVFPASAPPVASQSLHFNIPGEYRMTVPTEDQARELERTNPDGKLIRIGSGLLWVEPAFRRPT